MIMMLRRAVKGHQYISQWPCRPCVDGEAFCHQRLVPDRSLQSLGDELRTVTQAFHSLVRFVFDQLKTDSHPSPLLRDALGLGTVRWIKALSASVFSPGWPIWLKGFA